MPFMSAFAASLPMSGLPLRFRLPMAASLLAGLAWLLLDEQLASYHWLGGALIFSGLLLATRPGSRPA